MGETSLVDMKSNKDRGQSNGLKINGVFSAQNNKVIPGASA